MDSSLQDLNLLNPIRPGKCKWWSFMTLSEPLTLIQTSQGKVRSISSFRKYSAQLTEPQTGNGLLEYQ